MLTLLDCSTPRTNPSSRWKACASIPPSANKNKIEGPRQIGNLAGASRQNVFGHSRPRGCRGLHLLDALAGACGGAGGCPLRRLCTGPSLVSGWRWRERPVMSQGLASPAILVAGAHRGAAAAMQAASVDFCEHVLAHGRHEVRFAEHACLS